MRSLWQKYNLSIVLLGLFLVSWVAHGVSSWFHYVSTQEAHGQALELAGFAWQFANETFENWQSEFLQLFTMVVLTSCLVHLGSGEGKQNQEQADRVERLALEAAEQMARIHGLLSDFDRLRAEARKELAPIRSEQRKLALQLTRMEQAERNRRLLSDEQADHEFIPMSEGAATPNDVCAVPDCILPRRQHGATFEVGR